MVRSQCLEMFPACFDFHAMIWEFLKSRYVAFQVGDQFKSMLDFFDRDSEAQLTPPSLLWKHDTPGTDSGQASFRAQPLGLPVGEFFRGAYRYLSATFIGRESNPTQPDMVSVIANPEETRRSAEQAATLSQNQAFFAGATSC